MKNMLWIVVLIGLIGALVWGKGYFDQKKEEAPQAAEVTKLEEPREEAQKSDSDEKGAVEKPKLLEVSAKLAELQKQYNEKKSSFMALKKGKTTLQNALSELEKKAPEFVAGSEEHQRKRVI